MAVLYLEGILKRVDNAEAVLAHKSELLHGRIPWDVLEQNVGTLNFGLDFGKELSIHEAVFMRLWAISLSNQAHSYRNVRP